MEMLSDGLPQQLTVLVKVITVHIIMVVIPLSIYTSHTPSSMGLTEPLHSLQNEQSYIMCRESGEAG